MASTAIATTSADARIERYRETERELWDHYGLEPTERFSTSTRRPCACACSKWDPATPYCSSTARWALARGRSLINELPGFRSIVLERPGWGLSSAVDFSKQEYKTLVADVLRELSTRSSSSGHTSSAARSATCGRSGLQGSTPRGSAAS